VNALTDTGAGSGNTGDLRYCMTMAQESFSPGADVINFDATKFASLQTITITSALPTIDNDLTITGTGSAKVVLDLNGAALSTAVLVTDPAIPVGATLSFTGFSMKNASSSDDMYMTLKDANVNLTDVALTNGTTTSAKAKSALSVSGTTPATFSPT